ncbi:MAG: TonB-dependent receptor [Bacteroidota bacterium]
MKHFLLALLIFYPFVFAQAQGIGNVKISGHVKDSLTSQGVEFANVIIIDPATKKPINGTVCDDKGKFVITNVSSGTFTVEISFIGFGTKRIENLIVADKNIDLGSYILSPSVQILKELIVEGQRQLIEEKVDRTIYNAENDATTKGGDATDVLKRVPMLSVDLDGNVSMRGNQNIRVLINNKPSTIAASSVADALKQIPAEEIKSVEVITSPSAKYDAEGSAGIINIITKKNTLQGATLNVNAGAGLRGSNLGLNGNYRKGKMGFSVGGFGRAGYNIHGAFENEQIARDTLGNLVSTSTQEADTRSTNLFGRYQLGWDYDINKYNSLTASARYGVRNGSNYQDNLFSQTYDPSNTLTLSTLTDVKIIDNSGTVDLSLDYMRTFEKPQKEFSISTLYSRNNRNNDFTNTNFGTDDIIDNRIKNENQSYNQEITLQADYQTPITTKQLVEFGGKNIMRKVSSDYKSFLGIGEDGEFTESQNAKASNIFNYNQNVTAGYLSYTVSLPKSYSLKAGTRYEYTVIDANFENPTETETTIPSYGVMVPSVNLSKRLKNGNTLKVAYNRRIQRPSIQFLNPNIQAGNRLNITIGNPNLDPEFTNNYELAYSTFIKGTSLNFSTFVRNTTGSIQSIRELVVFEGNEVIQTTYDNIGQEDAYGGSVFSNVNIGSKFSLNGGADFYYAVLDNRLEDPLYKASNEGWVASGRLRGNYNLSKGWGFQFFGFLRGRQVQLQGTQGGFGIYSLGLKKDFANKKGNVGFGLENFINPVIRIKSNIESVTISQSSINERQNLSFRVNLSYRFGKMGFDNAPRKRKKSVSNDDLKDDGGDGGGQDDAQQGQTRNGFAAAATTAKKSEAKDQKADPTVSVNAVGTWAYTIESPRGGVGNLTIKKDGKKYSGILVNTSANRETQLKTVAVNGNELSFSYETNFGGNTSEIVVKGIISGDQFTGTMQMGQFGSFPFIAKRTE